MVVGEAATPTPSTGTTETTGWMGGSTATTGWAAAVDGLIAWSRNANSATKVCADACRSDSRMCSVFWSQDCPAEGQCPDMV